MQQLNKQRNKRIVPVFQQVVKYRTGHDLGALELWAVRYDAGLSIVHLAGEIFGIARPAELVPAAHAERRSRVIITNPAAEGRGGGRRQTCVAKKKKRKAKKNAQVRRYTAERHY